MWFKVSYQPYISIYTLFVSYCQYFYSNLLKEIIVVFLLSVWNFDINSSSIGFSNSTIKVLIISFVQVGVLTAKRYLYIHNTPKLNGGE